MLSLQRQEQLRGALGLFVAHARGGLVEQQHLRLLHQQHADFQPLLLPVRQKPRGIAHALFEIDLLEHFVDAIFFRRIAPVKQRIPHAFRAFDRQLEIFVHAVIFEHRRFLKLAADAEARDLVLGRWVRSMVWPRNTVPVSGRVLPVMTSIMVVLPAPLGPMTQRSSPTSMENDKIVEGAKAVEADRHALEVKNRLVRDIDRFGLDHMARYRCFRCRRGVPIVSAVIGSLRRAKPITPLGK